MNPTSGLLSSLTEERWNLNGNQHFQKHPLQPVQSTGVGCTAVNSVHPKSQALGQHLPAPPMLTAYLSAWQQKAEAEKEVVQAFFHVYDPY